MLYTKSIQEITWEDIVLFCYQGIPENPTLDYKKDFPKNLQKSIAAFANTLGGLIIIGVDEDDQSKPILPIEGIENNRGLAERVTNIILTNISPPVFPEITVCENSDKSKVIVIIRIPQSHQSPHAINQNTQVYLRTNNRNTPEELATIDKIYWLRDKRNNSLMLRHNLIEDAHKRFSRIILSKKEEITNTKHNSWLTILMAPFFPDKYYLSPPEINAQTYNLSVNDVYLTRTKFPASDRDVGGTLFQNGTILNDYFNERAYYCEFNCFGLLFYKQNMYSRITKSKESNNPTIRFDEVVARLYNYFELANNYYNFIGYKGHIFFYYKMENIDKYPLIFSNSQMNSIDDTIIVSKEYKIQELKNPSVGLYVDALQKLGWAYNISINEKSIIDIHKNFSQ